MSRDIEAGRAYVRVSVKENMAGLKRVSAKMKTWGAGIAKIGTGIGGFGVLATAAFIEPIRMASDMQETMNKFNVVFGDTSSSIKKWSDDFGSSIGRSKKQIADFMAGSQDLFVPLGFAKDAAIDMSKQVTKLAVDLGSFNNVADSDVLRDLHAALTGSGEVMKKYGVLVSEAAVKQELFNQGIDPKTITDQQKVQARLNIIMAGTKAAQGDAARSAGSFANQMKSLKAKLADVSVEIGSALLPAITPMITEMASIAKIATKWTSENKNLVKTIALIAVSMVALGAILVVAGGVMAAFGMMLTPIIAILTGVAGAITFLVSPIGLLVVAIIGIGLAISGAIAYFLLFTDAGKTMATKIKSDILSVVTIVKEDFVTAFETVKETLKGIGDAISASDYSLAAKIAMQGLQLAYLEGTQSISVLWTEFNKGLVDAFANSLKKITALAKLLPIGIVTKLLLGSLTDNKIDEIVKITKFNLDVGVNDRLARIEKLKKELMQLTVTASSAKHGKILNDRMMAIISGAKNKKETGPGPDKTTMAGVMTPIGMSAAIGGGGIASAMAAVITERIALKAIAMKKSLQVGGGMLGTFSSSAASIGFAGIRTDDLAKRTADATERSAKSLKRLEKRPATGAVFA